MRLLLLLFINIIIYEYYVIEVRSTQTRKTPTDPRSETRNAPNALGVLPRFESAILVESCGRSR